MTPVQLALLGLQIRQRRAMSFVERVDAGRLAYASTQDKDALAAYQRLRRRLLNEVGMDEQGERRILTPNEAANEQQALKHPVPSMFQGASPEFWQHVRVIQRER